MINKSTLKIYKKIMFNNIKVIAADIDGTITRSDRTTSNENIECIRKSKEKHIFGLASGRPAKDIMSRYELWGLDKQFDFIIGWNGCQLYDDKTKKLYKYNYLTKDEFKEIIDIMSIYESTICMYKPMIFCKYDRVGIKKQVILMQRKTCVLRLKVSIRYLAHSGEYMLILNCA